MIASTSYILKCLLDFSIRHTILVLGIMFSVGVAAIVCHLNHLSDIQIRSTAIQNSRILSEALTEFRTLYTSEVVVAAKAAGLEVTHDYATRDGAIPLPATFSMLLGRRLAGHPSGATSRLYSPFPFPWRENSGGLRDSFAQDAWLALLANPEQAFYRFEIVDGLPALRYATADLMRESCIGCHNSHPDTPKNDWSTGQLRGVMEVITPIESQMVLNNDMVRETFYLTTGVMLLSLIGIGFVLNRLHERTDEAHALAETARNINHNLVQEMQIRENAEAELLKLSNTDALTGIGNRRIFDIEFEREWKRALRSHYQLAILLIDIDHFKTYNDNYGHQAGDDALRQVATAMSKIAARSSDLLARFGGEEFVLLMPDTNEEGAMLIGEKLRREVENLAIPHEFAQTSKVVTVSIGLTAMVPAHSIRRTELIEQADRELYRSKKSGRNCVNGQRFATPAISESQQADVS